MLFGAVLGWSSLAQAVPRFAIATNNWNVAATWSNVNCASAAGGGVPAANDDVTICPTRSVTLDVNTPTLNSLTVNGTFDVRGFNLTVTNATIVNGTMTFTTSNAGTKSLRGTVTINPGGIWTNPINEAIEFRGGIVHDGTTFDNGTGAVTITTATPQTIGGGSAMTFGGAVTLGANIVVNRTNTSTITIAGILNGTNAVSAWNNNAGTLNYTSTGSANAPMNSGALNAGTNPNTVIYARGGGQNIKATTYYNLELATSGAKTAVGGVTANGNLTLSGMATFNASTFTHNFAGNWIVNTTAVAPIAVATTSLINFNSPTPAAGTSIGGTSAATLAFADVGINNTSGVTLNENASFSTGTTPTLTIGAGATLTPAAGVFVSGTGTLTGSGTAQVTRTAATPDFLSQYTITNRTLTNLTVDYAAAAAQTVNNLTYGHLRLSGSGVKTMPAAALSVTGNFSMAGSAQATPGGAMTVGGGFDIGGTSTFNASSFTHNVAGDFARTGTFNANTGTFNFNGTNVQTFTGTATFNHLTISNTTNPITTGSNITVNGNVNNTGTHTGAGRIVLSGGGAAHQLSGNGIYGGLELNDALGATLTGSPAVTGTLTMTAGNLTTGLANTLSIGSAGGISGAGTSRHVVGTLAKSFVGPAPVVFTYAIGDGTNYTPITVNLTTLTTPGILAATTPTPPVADHPDALAWKTTSSPVLGVNRYWTLKNSTLTGTYSATLNYLSGTPVDLDAGVVAATFVVARGTTCSGTGPGRLCAAWSRPTLGGVPSSTQATGTGIAIASGDPDVDLVVGQPATARFAREREFVYTRELY